MDSRTPRPVTHDRAQTWPPATTGAPVLNPRILDSSDSASRTGSNSYADKLDLDPATHFLSEDKMYRYDQYDDWSSESDDDEDDDVEWNSGITDFALFDSDRRRAEATGRALPEKWSGMLSDQASALNRAIERSEREAGSEMHRSSSDDSVPGLTPDGSPHLHDDLQLRTSRGQIPPIVPNYLNGNHVTMFSPEHASPLREQSALIDDADDDSLSFFVQPRHTPVQQIIPRPVTRPARPGLTNSRTLSGRDHSWRPPSWDITPVREDQLAELRAEQCAKNTTDCHNDKFRKPN